MATMVASDIDGDQEYEILVDAGVPTAGDRIAIEVVKGEWRDFQVVERSFNFGTPQTHVVLRVREVVEPDFPVEVT